MKLLSEADGTFKSVMSLESDTRRLDQLNKQASVYKGGPQSAMMGRGGGRGGRGRGAAAGKPAGTPSI